MSKLLTLLLLLFGGITPAQSRNDVWKAWDEKYQKADLQNIIQSEKQYADGVEKHPEIIQTYCKFQTLRLKAIYTGKLRVLDAAVKQSMQRVAGIYSGSINLKDLEKLQLRTEVLFQAGSLTVWMPVQPGLLKAMQKEIKPGDPLVLYCLFLNERTADKRLFNTFLISEFRELTRH